VENGSLGDILYARVWALRRRGIPNWGMFVRKDLQGGGPMIDIGVHAIEMAHFAMGSPRPVAASGTTYTYLGDQPSDAVECPWKGWDYENYSVEDLATGYVRFENGATMSIEASFAAHLGRQGMDFTLMGTRGGAQQADPQLYYDRDGYMVDATPAYLPKTDAFQVKMDAFVDCCLYDKPNMASGEEGLMIQKILDGIYASSEAGKEVAID
jgi:predicted dehydrogenase